VFPIIRIQALKYKVLMYVASSPLKLCVTSWFATIWSVLRSVFYSDLLSRCSKGLSLGRRGQAADIDHCGDRLGQGPTRRGLAWRAGHPHLQQPRLLLLPRGSTKQRSLHLRRKWHCRRTGASSVLDECLTGASVVLMTAHERLTDAGVCFLLTHVDLVLK